MLSGCHIRDLNPLKTNSKRITKVGRNMANDLDYEGIEFSVSKKYYSKIEQKVNISINVFCYENYMVYPFHILDQNWIY